MNVPDTDWLKDRHDMVFFAIRWAPFGGGAPEDIWTQFGVAERVFFLRLRQLLSGQRPAGADDLTWTRLRAVCDARLDVPAPPISHTGDATPA
ncbi:hypothetical protein [Williamsia sterculiae]|uniref:DUF3263 domain-containing protein n=1 Tax=Williamsia sterculiae TaxID=1344003 RepID=A0A1N7FXC1_9NOCA|nr:hypothetical protein [Williamsia sterculiae]SIS04970.1 hypothetical protein SAMN05445060_2372 [Williamsia sterculiae]